MDYESLSVQHYKIKIMNTLKIYIIIILISQLISFKLNFKQFFILKTTAGRCVLVHLKSASEFDNTQCIFRYSTFTLILTIKSILQKYI